MELLLLAALALAVSWDGLLAACGLPSISPSAKELNMNKLSNGIVWFLLALGVAMPALVIWAAYEIGTTLP